MTVRILIAVLLVPAVHGATYFVTQAGAGSHNGTSIENAWSVSNFNSTTTPTGGDTVLFSGTITSKISPSADGTGNGSARLTLDFSGATLTAPAISLSGNDYLTLNGGTVAAGPNGSDVIACAYAGPGIGHDITIQNFTYTAASHTGSDMFFSVGSCSNVLIQNNSVTDASEFINEGNGETHDITILNNYFSSSANVTEQSDSISLGDTINVIIQGNKLIQNAPGAQSNSRHNDVIQTFQSGATNNQAPRNWVIRYNWIEANIGSGGDGSNSWTILENVTGDPGMKIYGNVFVGSGSVFWTNGLNFNSSNTPVSVYLYNNTFAVHGDPGNTIRFQNSGTLYSRNNVGMASPTFNGTYLSWAWSAGATWNRNFFYQFGDCSPTYSGASGSCSANPLFTDFANNDLSTQSGSPLRGAGDSTIGEEYNQGIAPGATWPNPTLVTRTAGAWDVGAFQFSGDPPPETTSNSFSGSVSISGNFSMK